MAKILCFIDELGSGGAERQLVGLASLLKNYGYIVDVYCYHPVYFYEPILIENDVNLIKVKSSPKNAFEKFFRSYKVITTGKYDVVISYAPGAVLASLITKIVKQNFRLIVSDRNSTPKICFRQQIMFNLYRFADFIVPNSYNQTNILISEFPFMSKKIHTITNFVDFLKFNPVHAKTINNDGKLNIIVVARHSPIKNAPNFIKAIKQVKERGLNIHVQWFGNIENYFCQQYIDLAKKNGVDDIIEFLPHQTNIEYYYHKSDVLCLPSFSEGFSNVIGEAMCCGLPILCSNVGDNLRMVENGINGFVFDPTSPQEIAETISKFYFTSYKKRREMGDKSRIVAENILSSETFIRKYLALININLTVNA